LTTIEFELTPEDFVAFNLHHAATSPFATRQRGRGRIAISVALFVLVTGTIALSFGSLVEGLLAGAIAALLMWFIFPWSWRRGI
jgi:hypothetical protein